MQASRTAFTVLLLALLILGAGAHFRYLYNEGTRIDNPVRGDARQYLLYSRNLVVHGTFSKERADESPTPDSYWAPGYPAFLAGITLVSRHLDLNLYSSILYVQLFLGALIILFTFLLAGRCLPGPWPLLPALLVAMSPHLVSTGQFILTEILTAFLLVAGLYFAASGMDTRSKASLFIAGCLLAACYLTNPVTVFTAPLVAVFAYRRAARAEGGIRNPAWPGICALVLPLAIAASLWGLRGALNVPADAPSSSSRLMINLVQGMDPAFHDDWRHRPGQTNRDIQARLETIDGSYSNLLKQLVEQLTSEPGAMLSWYFAEKPLLLWGWDMRVGAGDIYIYPVHYSLYDTSGPARASYSLMKALHVWLFACAVLSIFFIARQGPDESSAPALIYGSVLLICSVYVVAQSEPRYSIPLRPEMYILATYFLRRLYTAYQGYRSVSAGINPTTRET